MSKSRAIGRFLAVLGGIMVFKNDNCTKCEKENDLVKTNENLDNKITDAKESSNNENTNVLNKENDDVVVDTDAPSFNETAKIFGVSEEKLLSEFNSYKAVKLFKRTNLSLLDNKIRQSQFSSYIKNAINYGIQSITVSESLFLDCKKAVSGSDIKIRVCCNYPFGYGLLKNKLKVVSKFAKLGADGIELCFDISDLYFKRQQQIVREWKRLRKKAGKIQLIMVVDFDILTLDEVGEILQIAKKSGVQLIKTSTFILSKGSYDFLIGDTFNLSNINLEIGVLSPTAQDVLSSFKWGATSFSSPNLINALKDISKVLGTQNG